MPLQHRHTYAADLRCGLRADEKDTDRRSHPPAGTDKCALLSRPISPRLEPVRSIERLSDAGSSRTPSRFACRARAVWACRPASSLSGLLPTLPCTSRIRLPSASPACCDRPEAGSFHPHPVSWRLVAHFLVETEDHGLGGGSDRGAVAAFRLLRFPGPPSEPDVRVCTHPALHVTVSLFYAAESFVAHGEGIVLPR